MLNPPAGAREISVVIPTVGRPENLRRALLSLGRCEPAPAEIIVVDQSREVVSGLVVDEVGPVGTRVIGSETTGRGAAVNRGLMEARHVNVLITDDDCTVRSDWVEAAEDLMQEDPDGIVCGQVLPPPGDDPRLIPSTISLDAAVDYTGHVSPGVLYAGNMACPREEVLAFGGFDERIVPSAEDCDFCYRWLRDGRRLRQDPSLVVWHHAWRTPSQLRRHYVNYYRGNGVVYAKHLAAGDLRVLRFLLRDWYTGLLSLAGPLKGVEPWADCGRGALSGLPRGLREGWRTFRRNGEASAPP